MGHALKLSLTSLRYKTVTHCLYHYRSI